MQRKKGPEALTVGETMVMVASPTPGAISAETSFMLRPGGAEANVAVHLARLGHCVEWAGLLGADPFGSLVLSYLEDVGVGVEHVRTVPGAPTGVYFKDASPDGTRVYYYRTGSAASQMDTTYVESLRGIEPAVLHLSGITPALSDDCHEAMRRLLIDRAVATPCVSFDVNYRPGLWRDSNAGDVMRELAASADVVFVGLDEATSLWNVTSAPQVRALLPEPKVLVVKNSSHGAISFGPEGVLQETPATVAVVEPVGAGDAFAAGWLSGLLRGADPRQRLVLGHAIAGHVLQTTFDDTDLPASLGVGPQSVGRVHQPSAE
ncbi:sugar kinase [Cellulomonas sp. KRMCY2]|uniref:sugar kinase n=1 Tax=Cellulomonas sp. KRMCY2 TaxID=1304865 RepID=UPI00045E9A54|nr:sugar kinase [Cellulomonas sp. KRMCY2]